MARDIAEAARVRGDPSGPYGLSACIASAVARQIDRDNLDELIQAAKGARGARPALGLLPSSTVELVAQCLGLFVISSSVTGPWSALRATVRHATAHAGPGRRTPSDDVGSHLGRSGPPRINRPALEQTLFLPVVESVTGPIARHAAAHLADDGPHDYGYAIDAMARRVL
jgi:hypothetical protein